MPIGPLLSAPPGFCREPRVFSPAAFPSSKNYHPPQWRVIARDKVSCCQAESASKKRGCSELSLLHKSICWSTINSVFWNFFLMSISRPGNPARSKQRSFLLTTTVHVNLKLFSQKSYLQQQFFIYQVEPIYKVSLLKIKVIGLLYT